MHFHYDDNKYLLAATQESNAEIYFQKDSFTCDEGVLLKIHANGGEFVDAYGWNSVTGEADALSTNVVPGHGYPDFPEVTKGAGYTYYWNTKRDGSGVTVDPRNALVDSRYLELYAVWTYTGNPTATISGSERVYPVNSMS